MKRTRVYMGLPTTGTVSDSQTYALRELERLYADSIELVYPEKCVRRMFHDFARNMIVEDFLASDCDILWFLDSDICPPKHVLDLITKHGDKWQAAGAPYPVFITQDGGKDPEVVFCVYKGSNGKGLGAAAVPYEGTEFVDGLATGCMFLKREVFSKLERPYFEFKYDAATRNITEGEDLGFCMKLQKLGVQFFTDYSMVCKHYKNVCLLEVNNYATNFSNRSVAAYDRMIRGQIDTLVSKVQRPKSGLILPNG